MRQAVAGSRSERSASARLGARFLVLQHIGCEPPGAYGDELTERGMAAHCVRPDTGEALPDWRAYDGVIAMGGPMGAYDDAALPWLSAEKRLVAEAVRAGMPFWGVCLGAQLLASALDAPVYVGPAPEVGLLPVFVTSAAAGDPVFAACPTRFDSLQWHGDTFDLPEGAVLLASSDAYPHQAFAWKRAYGLQFHVEVSAALAASWAEVPEYAESLERMLGPEALPNLVAAVRRKEAAMTSVARGLFGAWLDAVVVPRRTQALVGDSTS